MTPRGHARDALVTGQLAPSRLRPARPSGTDVHHVTRRASPVAWARYGAGEALPGTGRSPASTWSLSSLSSKVLS